MIIRPLTIMAPRPTPPGPSPLPPIQSNTVRVRTIDGNAPIKGQYTEYETATLVTGTTDVYDVYKSGTSFNNFLYGSSNVVEILGANTVGVTDMGGMFDSCSSLTTITLFDTSSVTKVDYMFWYCYKVESGALALYQQMSTQTTPPNSHSGTFTRCGRDTTTGAAELAQIPSSWGGTGA